MSTNALNPFPPDALEANRRGELTDAQLHGFRGLSRIRRKGALDIAGILVVVAFVIGLFAPSTFSAVLRALTAFSCLAIAAFLVLRSIGAGDALTRDLRHVRVESVEGAIGKSCVSSLVDGAFPTYILDVGDSRIDVMPMTYEAAPDAGYVRLYFLPHSRKVVNLERLPDRPVQPGATAKDIVRSLGAATRSHDRRALNETRATMAGIGNALEAALAQPIAATPETRDSRPLGEAILGTWSNGIVTAKFSSDGHVATRILGRENVGRWSVDANGRLSADVTGQQQALETWVAGNQLIISAQGKGLTHSRIVEAARDGARIDNTHCAVRSLGRSRWHFQHSTILLRSSGRSMMSGLRCLRLSVPLLLVMLTAASVEPLYTAQGALIPPSHYREWVFLSAGLDMSYTNDPAMHGHSMFDNVFVDPSSWAAFKRTGHWPDKAMFALETRGASTHGSINKHGQYQTEDLMGLEFHVHDEARFKGGWGFFAGNSTDPETQLPLSAPCYACHRAHGAVDTTFTQFYPTAKPIAIKAGTYREQ